MDLTVSNLAGQYDLILDISSMMCTVADVVSLDFKVAGQAASPPFFFLASSTAQLCSPPSFSSQRMSWLIVAEDVQKWMEGKEESLLCGSLQLLSPFLRRSSTEQ